MCVRVCACVFACVRARARFFILLSLIILNPQCTIMSRFRPSQNYFLKFLQHVAPLLGM